ncbi:Amidase [Purpureocillium takamizusanense]|uniref:Amidase n=1 Tax=Purpureocillium takamizusanense TaxID=2060973 RepID=A0A9Q8V8W4_9HYPO|nr:Amidase [Purpureocillium takamizusanense]UNI17103.1 Amidase [Purpureocillium takamizusanense]
MSSIVAVVSPTALIPGPPEYEARRRAILEEFGAKVPETLRLPQGLIANPPKNVTAIPRECGILSPEEIEITETYDATALASAIASRKLTAVAVATAFAKRAIIAHQLTCCLTDWFMDEAVERARSLDEHLASTGKTVGPLHGVPISLKEHMPVAGHFSSTGFLDTRVLNDEDAHMISILRAAGAVFYCKTNQPQAIMHLESTSFFGRVLNPYNIGLSAGGSTGGEAALVAMRGSVLGVGTDIGGSVRGPAGFCGIYGFKPTSYTLPMKDFLAGGFPAELNVICSTGPMCNSLRDMDLFMRVVLAAKPYLTDPRLIPIPWVGLQSPARSGPIKIGILMNDGVITPQPPVIRALKWAQEKLEASGSFTVKPFVPYRTAEAIKNVRQAYWPDGGAEVRKHLAHTGEPIQPLTEWVLKEAAGKDVGSLGVHDIRMARDKFRCDFAEHWQTQDVDVVLCPVFVGPACEHETSWYWNYTAFWNYVDYPGAVFPTTIKAGKKGSEAYAPDAVSPLSDEDKHVRQLWDKGDFEDAPIDLQVVARKYHDNDLFAALAAMQPVLGI